MAKVKLHPAFQEISGPLGDTVIYKLGDQHIMRRQGEIKEWSQNQLDGRATFRDAIIYGRAVRDDPALCAVYLPRAKAKRCAPYHVALTDFLNAPTVENIDLAAFGPGPGSPLRIEAKDDFEVIGLHVVIRTTNQVLLQEGPASWETSTSRWLYQSPTRIERGQPFSVQAIATDRPGHTGTRQVFWCFPPE